MYEPRETLTFALASLLAGDDGLAGTQSLLALAPHLDHPVPVDAADIAALGALGATSWSELAEVSQRVDAGLLESLLERGLLLSDTPAHVTWRERDERLRATFWQPHAAVAHYFGRWQGVSAGDAADQAGLKTMTDLTTRLGPAPPAVAARAEPAQRQALPRPDPTALDDLLAQRVTCRNFDARQALPLATFAQVLWRVFGAQATLQIAPEIAVIKRTSPSGGGLHPTAAYLLVQHVSGLAPGLYHYHPVEHALEALPPPAGEWRALAKRLVAGQAYYADAHVQVIYVTRFARTFWKYRNHSKAYRVCLLDAGHLSQTLYLAATDAGLGAFVTAAINEVDIEQALGLDALEQSPVAIGGFGIRATDCTTIEFDPQQRIWSTEQIDAAGIP